MTRGDAGRSRPLASGNVDGGALRARGRFVLALAAALYSVIVTGALAGPVLTTVGPRVSMVQPSSVAFSPQVEPFGPGTRLLAAADLKQNTVTVFEVSNDGLVQRPVGEPVPTGSHTPRSVAFSRDGGLLAVANDGDTVSVFEVRPRGVLAGPQMLHIDAAPTAVAFSPREDVTLLVAASRNSNSLEVVKLAADGTPLGSGRKLDVIKPTSVAFSHDGTFLAAATNRAGGSVSVFRVMADLTLQETGTAPSPSDPSRNNSSSLAFSPRSGLLVATNVPGKTVSVFEVGSDGKPHLVGSPPTGEAPVSVTFSPDGKLVATANNVAASVSMFVVSGDGHPVLTPVPLPGRTGTRPVSVAFGGRGLLATANDSESADAVGSVSMFTVSARGALTPAAPSMPSGGDWPDDAAFSPDGKLLAVTNRSAPVGDSVAVFAQRNGVFRFEDSAVTEKEPIAVAFGPRGLLAVANHGDDSVWLYRVRSDGSSTSVDRLPEGTVQMERGSHPYALAFSHDGSLLAAAKYDMNTVSVFEVMSTNELRLVGTSSTGSNPASVAFSPVGGLLATANQGSNSVSMFRASTSGVAPVAGPSTPLAPGSGPSSVAFSSDGGFLATANHKANSLSLFSVSGDRLSEVGVPTTTGLDSAPSAVAFSPRRDQRLLAASNQNANTLSLFEVTSRGLTEVGSASPTGGTANAVAFSPDGLLATPNRTGGPGTVSVFTLAAPALDTFITGPPQPRVTNATSASFAFDANYPSIFECGFQGGPLLRCASGIAYQTPAVGGYKFRVRAKDLMGNVASRQATSDWVVDRTPPDAPTPIAPSDGAPDLPTSPVFRWSPPVANPADVTGYELWIDDARSASVSPMLCVLASCSASPSSPLAHGRHSWYVRALDEAGNGRATTPPRRFDVDASSPEAFALVGPVDDAATGELRPVLSWQAAVDAGIGVGSYRVVVDDVQVASELPASATTFTPTADLAEGVHRWQVAARDKHGNERVSPIQRFVVDVTAPVAKATAAPNPVLVGRTVTFDAAGSSDAGSGIVRHEWDLDGDGSFERDTGATANVTTSFAATGTVAVQSRVTDRVGLTAVSRIDQRVIAPTVGGSATVTINDGDPYTNDPKVTVTVDWPPSTTHILISNDGGFSPATKFELQTKISWTLESTGERDTKVVYVRFLRGSTVIDKGSDNIVLDEKPPVVNSAQLRSLADKSLLDLRARDRGASGLGALQVTNTPQRPGTKFKKLRARRATIEIAKPKSKGGLGLNPRGKVYVRVRDKAGNLSKWRIAQRARGR